MYPRENGCCCMSSTDRYLRSGFAGAIIKYDLVSLKTTRGCIYLISVDSHEADKYPGIITISKSGSPSSRNVCSCTSH